MRLWSGGIVWEWWGGREGEETDCMHMDGGGFEHGDVLILDGTVRFQHTRANHCRY